VRVVTTRVSTEAPIGFELDAALAISSHTHVKVSLCVTCVCVYVLQHDVCVRACDAKYADAISHAQYVAFDFHERCRVACVVVGHCWLVCRSARRVRLIVDSKGDTTHCDTF
jgi:hypothetical protein